MSDISQQQFETFLAACDLPLFGLSLEQLKCRIQFELDVQKQLARVELEFPFYLKQFEQGFSQHITQYIKNEYPHLSQTLVTCSGKIQAHKAANQVKPFNGVKNIIAVASGKGGVGKSSTAVNLALALKSLGANVGLLDADIYGPNLALMLGVPADTRPEVEAQKYLVPLKAHGIQSMSMSYVATEDTPMVWRGPKASGAFSQLMGSTLWYELDILLIDMPPGTGDIQLTLGQTVPVNGAVIVTTPQNMATQDAQKGIAMFDKVSVPTLGVVENMSTHICSNCGHEEHIFGEGGGELLARKFNRPFLGYIPLDAQIREDCDQGVPTVIKSPDSELANRYREIALKLQVNLATQAEVLNNPAIKLVSD